METELKNWLAKKLPEEGCKTVVHLIESLEKNVDSLTKQVAAHDEHAKKEVKRQTYLKEELAKAKDKISKLNCKVLDLDQKAGA